MAHIQMITQHPRGEIESLLPVFVGNISPAQSM